MDEEVSLKQRLALDDRAIKILEKKVHCFLSTLYKEPISSAQHSFENILVQLLSYQTNLERNPVIQKANDKDIKEYDNIIVRTAGTKVWAAKDIVTLKDDLIIAQDIRNHKLEYDRVARNIMMLETRDTYTESIENLKRDIEVLQREKEKKAISLEDRKKNLKQAVKDLKDLQVSVEEDRALITDDRRRVNNMEKGYISSDEEEVFNSSDEEEEQVEQEESIEQERRHHSHRFHKRYSDDEDEEGMVFDPPMIQ